MDFEYFFEEIDYWLAHEDKLFAKRDKPTDPKALKEDESHYWKVSDKEGRVEDYQEYLATYPTGEYAAVARFRPIAVVATRLRRANLFGIADVTLS